MCYLVFLTTEGTNDLFEFQIVVRFLFRFALDNSWYKTSQTSTVTTIYDLIPEVKLIFIIFVITHVYLFKLIVCYAQLILRIVTLFIYFFLTLPVFVS